MKRHRDCVTVQMEQFSDSWEPNNITKSAQRTTPGVLRTEEKAGFTLGFLGRGVELSRMGADQISSLEIGLFILQDKGRV